MNPQDCLDAPRWQWIKEKGIMAGGTEPRAGGTIAAF